MAGHTAYSSGAKAGALAGIIAGIVWILGTLGLYAVSTDSLQDLTRFVTRTFWITIPLDLIESIILGVIVGMVFAWLHDKFLKSSPMEVKGLLISVIIWFFAYILTGFVYQIYSHFFIVVLATAFGLAGFLVFGYFLGHFYKRFSLSNRGDAVGLS